MMIVTKILGIIGLLGLIHGRLLLPEINEAEEESDDYKRCELIKSELYDDETTINLALLQWERLLPKIVKVSLDKYESRQHQELEYPYGPERYNMLGPIGPSCKSPIEKYGEGDDEKRACGLEKLVELFNRENSNSKERTCRLAPEDSKIICEDKDSSTGTTEDKIPVKSSIKTGNNECVIYSIGSNNQWGFEEAIFNRTNCIVETFDCTMDKSIQPPAAIRSRVRLHPVCLSDSEYTTENGRRYVTWERLHELTGLVKLGISPTFLKIDVEGYEFPIMQSIIDSGKQLPLQIAMEMHYIRHEGGEIQYYRRVPSIEIYAFMNYLRKFGGYYILERRDHPICKSCVELLLAKLDCHNYALSPPTTNKKSKTKKATKTTQDKKASYKILLDSQNHPLLKESIEDAFTYRYFG